MKTKLYHGIKIIPNSASIVSISDKYEINYRVTFYFDIANLKTDFLSVHKYGFWIKNAMCMN